MRERRLRFRRRMAKGRAVSPVVATLILILIAVAAAAALYLWLVGWQRSVTGTIGTPGAQATLTIGGSTSAYPFDQLAVTQYEQNYTDVVISNNQGGSGAGMDAVCAGAVDIGAASFPVTASILQASYGCSASDTNIYIITEAYDAVDVIVPSANTHGLLSVNYDTLALIYSDATVEASGHPTLVTTTEANGTTVPKGIPNAYPTSAPTVSSSNPLKWNSIPAAVGGAILSSTLTEKNIGTLKTATATDINATSVVGTGSATGVDYNLTGYANFTIPTDNAGSYSVSSGISYPIGDVTFTAASTAGTVNGVYPVSETIVGKNVSDVFRVNVTSEGAADTIQVAGLDEVLTEGQIALGAGTACSSSFPDDICATAGSTTVNANSPCGFTVCAGGANATIQTVARSDASGTTQSFEARLLDAESPTSFASASQLQVGTTGFTGCGSSNYISDCGYVATYAEVGNPGVISQVAGDANAIGYASDGLARASGSGVGLVGFVGVGQETNAYATADPTWYGGILPTTGSSGTISLGINSQYKSADYITGYLGWRPFDLVLLSPPTGTAESFVSFVLDPANNANIASEAQEVSIYSVAAPPGGYPTA